MRILIVSVDADVTQRIRSVVNRQLADCPDDSVVNPVIAASRVSMLQPDLILIVVDSAPDDQDIATIKNIREVATGHIACIGPADDGKRIMRTLHEGGADQYLDIANVESELLETLKVVKSRIGEGAKQGKVIVLIGANGGCGTSTLAVNMASSLAKQHEKCALLDFDLESGDLATLLDLKGTHTLSDLCSNLNRIDRALFDNMFNVHSSGVHLLASPRIYEGPWTVTSEGLKNAVLMSRAVFPRVVVDLKLDHSQREIEGAILRLADRVLVVFRMELTSLRNCRRLIDRLDRLNVSRDRIEFVANRYGQPHDIPVAMAEDVLGIKITYCIPNDPGSVNRANNNGIPLVITSTWATIGRSITSMTKNLDEKLAERLDNAGLKD